MALLFMFAAFTAASFVASIDLSQFESRPTMVNLWATWCPPCVREISVLHAAQIGNPDVHFVFINQGESSERVGHWLAARNLPLRDVFLNRKSQALKAFDQ
ncbi:MAG: TlpA family protein disulfide reductase [Proteobacteria bacterium]|nr:MAG: TlpA family protein disulfide reductase [Pseudomonadota bacterium]